MRTVLLTVFLLGVVACGGNDGGQLPLVAPSAIPAPPPISAEPRLSPPTYRDGQPELGRTIALGEIVRSRVTPGDPTCGEASPDGCQYLRVPVSQNGVLEVTVRWSATPGIAPCCRWPRY
jgi:hypothetical protein